MGTAQAQMPPSISRRWSKDWRLPEPPPGHFPPPRRLQPPGRREIEVSQRSSYQFFAPPAQGRRGQQRLSGQALASRFDACGRRSGVAAAIPSGWRGGAFIEPEEASKKKAAGRYGFRPAACLDVAECVPPDVLRITRGGGGVGRGGRPGRGAGRWRVPGPCST